jgi:hypothetical protein
MDAKLSPPSARRRGPRGIRPPTLVVFGLLLLAGTLIQACSDNNGSSGPTFECREQKGGVKVLTQCTGSPARVVGDAVGGPNGTLNIQATVTPGVIDRGRRGGVQILLTSANGAPIQGGTVAVSSPGGKFDSSGGKTDPNGTFSTTMLVPCEVADGAYAINVVANGKGVSLPAAFSAATSTTNDPCAGITPPAAGGGGGAAALPVVSIAATTSTATDTTGTPGIFTVSRDVSSASPLQVFFTVSGTAIAGCPAGDYVALLGSVTIPANGTSATITVTPCIDAVPDAGKTVIVTISGDPAYSGGGNATVTIND